MFKAAIQEVLEGQTCKITKEIRATLEVPITLKELHLARISVKERPGVNQILHGNVGLGGPNPP